MIGNLCKNFSEIGGPVPEKTAGKNFADVSKKRKNRCEKSIFTKNEKNFIIHIRHKEHDAKNHMSISILVQKLVLKGGGGFLLKIISNY